MIKRIVWTLIIIVVLAAAGSFALVKYYLAPAATTASAVNADGTLNKPAIIGSLVSDTPTSITIGLQNGSQQKLEVSPTSTQVVSQVAAGETGKTLAQLAPGTMLLIVPETAVPTAAATISVVPMPAPASATAGGTPNSITGMVVSNTASSMTVSVQGSSSVVVLIDKNVQVLTNVAAGQAGKTLADIVPGTMVQVSGTQGSSSITANSIVVLSTLSQ